jgi:hypothetical protein
MSSVTRTLLQVTVEEAALADAKLEAWEPPSADDIRDMKGGW